MKRQLTLIVTVCILSFAGLALFSQYARDFPVKDRSGRTLHLSEYLENNLKKNEELLLYFMDANCGTCDKEIREFIKRVKSLNRKKENKYHLWIVSVGEKSGAGEERGKKYSPDPNYHFLSDTAGRSRKGFQWKKLPLLVNLSPSGAIGFYQEDFHRDMFGKFLALYE